MKFYFETYTLLVCFVVNVCCNRCPAPESITPCVCDSVNSQITCSGHQFIDLKLIFSKIFHTNGDQQFKSLFLTNSKITVLEDDVFNGIPFQMISITGANSLKRISKNALKASAYSLEEFLQRGENQFNDEYIEELFDALSSLVVVNRIYLDLTHATKIPDNAFKIVTQRQLKLESIHLNYIGGKFGSLETVGNRAFYYLDNLKYLSIANQPIKRVKAHAFDFEKSSRADLDIHLEATQLTAESFEEGVFTNSKRPLTVDLSNNHLNYLNEKVFKPVLELNESEMVTLIVQNNRMTCDCKVQWIVNNKEEYKYRVLEPECKHLGSLWDLSQKYFADC